MSSIPRRVLSALGLKQSVVGVFRHKNRPHYGVAYRDEEGRRCSRAFSYADGGDEAAAHAQAMKFRQKTLRAKARRRGDGVRVGNVFSIRDERGVENFPVYRPATSKN